MHPPNVGGAFGFGVLRGRRSAVAVGPEGGEGGSQKDPSRRWSCLQSAPVARDRIPCVVPYPPTKTPAWPPVRSVGAGEGVWGVSSRVELKQSPLP